MRRRRPTPDIPYRPPRRTYGALSVTSSNLNYRVLSDQRSYPRYQAMILHHLLLELEARHAPGSIDADAAAPVAGRG